MGPAKHNNSDLKNSHTFFRQVIQKKDFFIKDVPNPNVQQQLRRVIKVPICRVVQCRGLQYEGLSLPAYGSPRVQRPQVQNRVP